MFLLSHHKNDKKKENYLSDFFHNFNAREDKSIQLESLGGGLCIVSCDKIKKENSESADLCQGSHNYK